MTDKNFDRYCLINNIYIIKKVIKLYISSTLSTQLRNLNTDFTLGNCLFESVKLTKKADLDKYSCSSYSIELDSRLQILLHEGTMVENILIFGADMSSSVRVDNKGKYIFFLGEGSTQGLDDTTLTAETKYTFNFMQSGKRFVLSLHYNGSNSFLFLNATKVYQFKAKKITYCV